MSGGGGGAGKVLAALAGLAVTVAATAVVSFVIGKEVIGRMSKDEEEQIDESKSERPPQIRQKSLDRVKDHAHRSESQFVRQDFHMGEISSWNEFPHVDELTLGTFEWIGKEGSYELLFFLKPHELVVLQKVSKSFGSIASRLLCDKRYLHLCAIKGFDEYRFINWRISINSSRSFTYSINAYEVLKSQMNSAEKPYEKQIKKDIRRTFTDQKFFESEENIEKLNELLIVFSLHNLDIGYCQGMNYLAGFLLMQTNGNVHQSFWVLDCIMKEYDQKWLFVRGLPHLNMLLWSLEHLVDMYLPNLADFIRMENIPTSLYATEWFATGFTYVLPPELVVRIWDLFIVDGWQALFRFALAILSLCSDDLMLLDFEKFVRYMKTLSQSKSFDVEELVQTALEFEVTDRLIDELEEYYVRKVVAEGN